MKTLLSSLSSDQLLNEAAELLKAAFNCSNMSQKYSLYQKANDLKKIAAIIYKYELMQQQGDL